MSLRNDIDELNDDRDEDELAVPSPALIKYMDKDELMSDYSIEQQNLRGEIYDMHERMGEYGFDGDFDPNAGSKKRLDELELIIEALRTKQAAIKLTDDDKEILDTLRQHYEWDCEYEAYAAAERALGM